MLVVAAALLDNAGDTAAAATAMVMAPSTASGGIGTHNSEPETFLLSTGAKPTWFPGRGTEIIDPSLAPAGTVAGKNQASSSLSESESSSSSSGERVKSRSLRARPRASPFMLRRILATIEQKCSKLLPASGSSWSTDSKPSIPAMTVEAHSILTLSGRRRSPTLRAHSSSSAA